MATPIGVVYPVLPAMVAAKDRRPRGGEGGDGLLPVRRGKRGDGVGSGPAPAATGAGAGAGEGGGGGSGGGGHVSGVCHTTDAASSAAASATAAAAAWLAPLSPPGPPPALPPADEPMLDVARCLVGLSVARRPDGGGDADGAVPAVWVAFGASPAGAADPVSVLLEAIGLPGRGTAGRSRVARLCEPRVAAAAGGGDVR